MDEPTDELLQADAQLFDMSNLPAIHHKFDHIIGNQLMCSVHDTCTSITISPTAVFEPNAKGDLVLVEKLVR